MVFKPSSVFLSLRVQTVRDAHLEWSSQALHLVEDGLCYPRADLITPIPLLRTAVVDTTTRVCVSPLRLGPPGDLPSASSRTSAHRDHHRSFQRGLCPH